MVYLSDPRDLCKLEHAIIEFKRNIATIEKENEEKDATSTTATRSCVTSLISDDMNVAIKKIKT